MTDDRGSTADRGGDRTREARLGSPLEPEFTRSLERLLGVEVEVRAVIGEKRVPLGDLLAATPGADLLLLRRGDPIRLIAGEIDIGAGRAVEVAGRLALRVESLRPLEEIAADLGGRLRAPGRDEGREPTR